MSAPSLPRKAAAKDLDGLCAQLAAQSQSVEGQLRALRAEHEALRRCLDRAGVLPAKEVEAELQRVGGSKDPDAPGAQQQGAPPPPSPPVSPAAAAAAPGRCGQAPSLAPEGSPTAEARRCSEAGQVKEKPIRGRAAEATGPPPQPTTRSGAASPPPPQLQPQGVGRAGGRLRSLPRSDSGAKNLPRSKSARGLADDQEKEGTTDRKVVAPVAAATVPEDTEAVDVFDCISKLLDPESSAPVQQRAMRAFEQAMRNAPEPPNAWAGPGAPLSAVVRAGRADLARVLLRARADPNRRDGKGVSPLHLATFDGNFELCRVLLVARADVDSCDRHGQTPLFFAPTRDICKMLVERRSDATVLNRKGQSALHLAGRAGLHEVLEWFSTRASKSLVDLRDVHGVTARGYVQQSGVPKPEATGSSPRSSPRTSPRASRGRQGTQASPRASLPRRACGSTSRLQQQALGPLDATTPRGPSAVPSPPVSSDGAHRDCVPLLLPRATQLVEGSTSATAARTIQAAHSDDSPGKRAAEHYQICDALDAEEPDLPEDPLSPSCEEMFDGLGPDLGRAQAKEVLAAAVGLATAAVATAAELDVAAAAPTAASAPEAQASDGLANAAEPEAQGVEGLADCGVLDGDEEEEVAQDDDAASGAEGIAEGKEEAAPRCTESPSKIEEELDDEVF